MCHHHSYLLPFSCTNRVCMKMKSEIIKFPIRKGYGHYFRYINDNSHGENLRHTVPTG